MLRLSTFDWNPTGFVWASDRVVDAEAAPPNLLVRSDISGFDGTGFYRLALDPFTRERTDFGILLDHPAFRHQRILYPLLAWGVSGGDPVGAAWALIGINVAGLVAIAWLGGMLVGSRGRAWGLVFAANPAFALALGVDTAEIVAGAGLLAGVVLLRRERWAGAAAVLTLAVLGRETTLLLAAGGLVAHVLRRHAPDRPPLWVFATPLGAYVIWQGLLGVWWRGFALGSGASLDIAPPFAGIVASVLEWIPPAEALDALHLILALAVVAFGVTALRSVARGAGPVHERTALVLAVILVTLTSEAIWFHHWGFLRATSEMYLLGAAVMLADRRSAAHRLALAPAIMVSVWLNMLLFP